VTVDLAELAELAAPVAMLVPAVQAAVVVAGRASAVVWASRASAALVAVVARVAPGSMRVFSATAQQVVMLARAALVERAAWRARLARMLRRCSVVMAEPAVTLGSLVVARRVLAVPMEQSSRVTAVLVALAELAARAAMLVPAALEAVVLPGRAVAVVWASRASAAMVAMAARVAPGSMRAA
jgi:hypothetical protein